MKNMKTILLTTIFAGFIVAQAPPNPKFEVASIRPSQPTGTERVDVGVHRDGAQMRIVALPMRDYIARAYRVKLYQVTGPDWLTSERFDVNAKLPEGSNPEQIPEMLQSLLRGAVSNQTAPREEGAARICPEPRKAAPEDTGIRARSRRARRA